MKVIFLVLDVYHIKTCINASFQMCALASLGALGSRETGTGRHFAT
jgi:hypothetical protein